MPVVQASSSLVQWILLPGIILFAIATLFTLITLPVEFDASRRFLAWLNQTQVTNSQEYSK